MDRKQIGRIGLVKAIEYFTIQGYTVSIPMNDTQWYDLIVEKNGRFYTVQCKATATEDGTIDLRGTGGTRGTVYDHTLEHNIDFLFCVDKDLNCFNIPVKETELQPNRRSIQLRIKPNMNHQGFESYKYLIS